MTTPHEILLEAARRKLLFIPRGDSLLIIPRSRLTPDFLAVIRAHKPALLSWLAFARQLHVARQILCGEFVGCPRGTRIRLMNELNSFFHPLATRAFAKLALDDMEVGR